MPSSTRTMPPVDALPGGPVPRGGLPSVPVRRRMRPAVAALLPLLLPGGLPWRPLCVALLAVALAAPASLAAQGVGVGVRAGSVGVGVDVGVTLLPPLTLRAGVGSFPFSYNTEVEGIRYRASAPGVNALVGGDMQVLGPFRIMGGVLYRSKPFHGRARLEAGDEVGDYRVPEDGHIDAELSFRRLSPYMGIGLGRLTRGFGMYLDVAVAHSGDPDLRFQGSGNLEASPGFSENLERERRQALEQVPRPVLYPVVQVGMRLGLGF